MARGDSWTLNSSAPLATALGFANFGSGHGTTSYGDDSVATHTGTLNGFTGGGNTPADRWISDDTLGRRALGFAILPNWVQVPEAAADLTGSLSWGCWFRSSGVAYQCLISKAVDGDVRHFGLYLSGANASTLYVALAGVNEIGEGGANLTISTPWTVDTWHHVLATYNSSTGTFRIYLDGAQVLTMATTGTFAHRTCDLSVGCELGARYPLLGHLADPVIYSRVLSVGEVAALADPANVSLTYSGTAALTGTGGEPGGDGTVTPSRIYISKHGQSLVMSFGTGSDAPGVTGAPAAAPTIKVNGSSVALGNPYYSGSLENGGFLMPHLWWPVSDNVTINPGDTVTITLADSAVVTSAGATIALTDSAVENLSGVGDIPTSLPETITMPLGINSFDGSYFEPNPPTADWMKRSSGWLGCTDLSFTFDEHNFPTSPGTYRTILAQPTGEERPEPRDYALITPGPWTVVYRGNPADIHLIIDGGSLSPDSTSTSGSDHLITYDVPEGTTRLELSLTLTGVQAVTKCQVFDPHVENPLDPPRIHPVYLEQHRGTKCIRSMPMLRTNGSTAVNITDYARSDDVIYNGRKNRPTPAVVRWDPYTSGQWNRDGANLVKITTATPHGLKNGHGILVETPVGGGAWDETYGFPLAGGGTGPANIVNDQVMVLSATEAVVFVYYGAITTTAITGHTAPSGQYVFIPQITTPIDEPVLIASLLPQCDYWHNFAHGCDDASVDAQMDMILDILPVGRKLYYELSNESPWNFAPGYKQAQYWKAVAGETSGWSEVTVYLTKAAQIRDRVRAKWLADGRDMADCSLCLSFQAGSSARTTINIDFCSSHDAQGRPSTDPDYEGPIEFEKAAFALYLGVTPIGTTSTVEDYEALTPGQLADAGAAYVYHQRLPEMDVTRTLFAASDYADVGLVAYEGGPGLLSLGQEYSDSTYLRTACCLFHPYYYYVFSHFLSYWNEFGFELFCKYMSHNRIVKEGQYWRGYGMWTGIDQTAGAGTANIAAMTHPGTGLPRVFTLAGRQNPIARLYQDWNALMPDTLYNPPRFDITAAPYSCVPDGTTDCSDGFEQALADAKARKLALIGLGIVSGCAQVYVPPGGVFKFTRPFVRDSGVHLRGDGEESRIDWPSGYVGGIIDGHTIPASLSADRVDLHGKLDTTAAATTGVRYGFSTANDHWLQIQQGGAWGLTQYEGASFQGHDRWSSMIALSLAVAMGDYGGGDLPRHSSILGMGNGPSNGDGRPFFLYTHQTDAHKHYLSLRTSACTNEGMASDVTLEFSGYGNNVTEFVHEIDFEAGTAKAWADRVPMTITMARGSLTAGMRLAPSGQWPLVVGVEGAGQSGDPTVTCTHFTLMGFHLNAAVRFKTVSGAMKHLDGSTPNHGSVLFTRDTRTVILLPLQDPTDQWWLAYVDNLDRTDLALVVAANTVRDQATRMSGICMEADNVPLRIGTVLDYRVTDCTFISRHSGAVGAIPAQNSYPVWFQNCTFSANGGPAIEAFVWILSVEHIYIREWSYVGIDHLAGPVTINDVTLSGANTTGSLAAFRFTPRDGFGEPIIQIVKLVLDSESGGVENIIDVTGGRESRVFLDVSYITGAEVTGPLIKLRDWAGHSVQSRYRVLFGSASSHTAQVSAGASWDEVASEGIPIGDTGMQLTDEIAEGVTVQDALRKAAVAVSLSDTISTGKTVQDALVRTLTTVVWTDTVETGVTFLKATQVIASAAAGKVLGAGTGTILIKAAGNPSTTRITANTDNAGNRTSITIS